MTLEPVPDTGLNQSQLSSWNRCKYAWSLEWERQVVPRIERPKLNKGSAVHRGMDAGLRGLDPSSGIEQWRADMLAVELSTEEHALLDSIEAEANLITARALAHLDLGHRFATYVFQDRPAVELKLVLPVRLGKFTHFHGTLDWVARDLSNGSLWLVDHKVRETFLPDDVEQYNVQMAVYQRLLRRHGVVAEGSICHQIKSAAPKQPKRNKDGSMSRHQILTDWPTYEAALRQAGLNPDDYIDVQSKLADVQWFRESRAFWPDRIVDVIWKEVERTARAISHKRKLITRSVGVMSCKSCRVRDFCWAELHGHDTEYLLQSSFMRKGDEPGFSVPDFDEDT